MPIVSKLKVVMADRDISVNELSEKVGRSAVNLSHLRCNRSKGIRISLLEDLCRELHCQPGDLLVYEPPLARSRTDRAGGCRRGVFRHLSFKKTRERCLRACTSLSARSLD